MDVVIKQYMPRCPFKRQQLYDRGVIVAPDGEILKFMDEEKPMDKTAESPFKPGDVVAIHSGGPAMTVNKIFPASRQVEVVWFNEATLMTSNVEWVVLGLAEVDEDDEECEENDDE